MFNERKRNVVKYRLSIVISLKSVFIGQFQACKRRSEYWKALKKRWITVPPGTQLQRISLVKSSQIDLNATSHQKLTRLIKWLIVRIVLANITF